MAESIRDNESPSDAESLSDNLNDFTIGDDISKENLKKELDKLKFCAVKKGKSYIYGLWRALLAQWFSGGRGKVYIVTPFLDATRLNDVCQKMLDFKDEAKLGWFYVRRSCDNRKSIEDVKTEVRAKFEDKSKSDKDFIENVFRKIKVPEKTFHAKFVAMVYEDAETEVLVTSANFHENHFKTFTNGCENLETVFYQKMEMKRFMKEMIAPIDPNFDQE